VIVVHEQLPSDSHQKGWNGCLDALAAFLAPAS
jgi:hypothetical protein